MDRKKVLMFIGAGTEMVPGIRWARDMDLVVIATDMNPDAVGFQHADHTAVMSTRDIEGTVAIARKFNAEIGIDGVMTLASDVPLTVATVADELRLPGLSVEIAELAQDKLLMKQRFAEMGVPIPKFRSVLSCDEAISVCREIGYPVVVKPVDNSAARGVSLVRDEQALPEAFSWATRHRYQEETILIEEFLPGPQISTESLVYDGHIYTTGFADRNYELNYKFDPYFVENGHTIPSKLTTDEQTAITKLAEDTIRAMGIDFGVGKGDIVLTEDGPKVIEFAARLSGGRFSTDTVPLATGVNIVKSVISLSVGEQINIEDLQPKFQRAAAQRYFFPEPGHVVSIEGVDEVESLDWITRVEVYVEPGELIKSVTNHAERAGYVIAEGDTRKEAVIRAEDACRKISIRTVEE